MTGLTKADTQETLQKISPRWSVLFNISTTTVHIIFGPSFFSKSFHAYASLQKFTKCILDFLILYLNMLLSRVSVLSWMIKLELTECHASWHFVQKAKLQYTQLARLSASSASLTTGILHRGQYSISPIVSKAFYKHKRRKNFTFLSVSLVAHDLFTKSYSFDKLIKKYVHRSYFYFWRIYSPNTIIHTCYYDKTI